MAIDYFSLQEKLPSNPITSSALENGKAIYILAKKNKCSEAYIIARSLIERLITYHFILSSDDSVRDDYFDYSEQRKYRNLDRSITINDKTVSIKATTQLNVDDYPKLKDVIEKFTGERSGKAKTRWTSNNLMKMLSVIGANSDLDITQLMAGMNYIYSDASESLHGTLYGCGFHFAMLYLIMSLMKNKSVKNISVHWLM